MRAAGLTLASALLAAALLAHSAMAASVPLRGDFPPGAGDEAVPVAGGIPFPKGELPSVDNVRLLGAGAREVPCQVTRLALWPDGSVKWAMIDAVMKPSAAKGLTLEYGEGVKRAGVADPIEASVAGGNAQVSGGGVSAAIRSDGGGVLDELSLGGKEIVRKGKPARLVINTLRIPDGKSGEALPVHSYVCRDTSASLDVGKVKVETVAIECPGPVRATVLVRGYVELPRFGSTLPDRVKQREGTGRMPFSMRLSFHRGTGVVYGQHQIIFSGEPDCDYIARWGIELPGLAGPKGALVLEPGVELDQVPGKLTVAADQQRLCWAPISGGFALIREGWQNRPCAVTVEDGSAWIDFWPRAAGVWDLRRYAREWAVGESGDTKNPGLMQFYAKYAARGIAKSHNFVISSGGAQEGTVRALSGRAMLLAPPAWYGSTGVLGRFAPEQTAGPYAEVDAKMRRQLDYHIYCQDLYNWYGKIDYGFWQTRYGHIHRHDRFDRDYGRWAWSLNDGAGRVGHVLMLQYLRSLDRRYLEAGEAFNRINYDTNMVHTVYHLENSRNWWTATGCSHRHNVQPFGCPYIGMRGSYPVGQRILYLLTGDGVIGDGLDLVAEASFLYVNGQGSRLCNSGGSDGQGSASNALLWKYETTGDRKYLDACRAILDRSGLVPPQGGKRLGYGPSFGLFNAADEYAEVSGDDGFQARVVELAKLGASDKNPGQFLHPIVTGYAFSKDDALKAKIDSALKGLAAPEGSLDELPPARWPGHGGWRKNTLMANTGRDTPLAIAALTGVEAPGKFPEPRDLPRPLPAKAPELWYRPGGAQAAGEKVASAASLLGLKAPAGGGDLAAGKARWRLDFNLADKVEVGGASVLSSPMVPYVALSRAKDSDPRLSSEYKLYKGEVSRVGKMDDGSIVAGGKAGPATFVARLRAAQADGVPSVRVEMALRVPQGSGRVASWGLLIPTRPGGNANAIQTTAPGRFRLERCRLDQNDERIPNWLTSEYHWGEGASLWPKWRQSGISMGPGRYYRIWRANMASVSPVFCDLGEGDSNWLDLTDRGAAARWGLTVRLLRPGAPQTDTSRLAVRANLETGLVEAQFHDSAAEPLGEAEGAAGLAGAADVIFHDGWRAPLSRPELTAEQYEKFVDDLDYGGIYGLCALRFCLSIDHRVKGRSWMEKIRDLGVEPREILYGMQWRDGLKSHCEKLGVKWDGADVEGSVRRVIEHYRK